MTGGQVEPRRLLLDWRGKPDLSKRAEFYSIAATATKKPILGNPNARVLVAISPTILYDGDQVAGELDGFNQWLAGLLFHRDALTTQVLWQGPGQWHTRLVDITKRGVVQDMLALIERFFGWAHGIHVDGFTAWAEPYEAWDRALAGLASGIRAQQHKLCLAQQFHPTPPSMAASGEFFEQSPTSFGQTMESHAKDIAQFRELLKQAKDDRETLFVAEIREPERFPDWYLAQVRSFALANDVVLSYGRDAQSVGL